MNRNFDITKRGLQVWMGASLILLGIPSLSEARDYLKPTPISGSHSASSNRTRTFDPAPIPGRTTDDGTVNGMAPPRGPGNPDGGGNNNVANTDPGGNPNGFGGGGGNDQGSVTQTVPKVTPGDAGSTNENNRGGVPPTPPQPFPQLGGISGGGGSGAGSPPPPAQFQQIPSMPGMQFPSAPNDVNLTGLLSASSKQMANTLDGGRLTALTDSLGEQMKQFQQTLFGIMETNSAAMKQGLVNAQNGLGRNNSVSTQYVGSQIGVNQTTAVGQPRVNVQFADGSSVSANQSGRTSGGTLSPRTSVSSSTNSSSSRSPASTSSGQRGRLLSPFGR